MTHICEAHIAYVYNEWNVFIFNIPYHAGWATEIRNSCGLNLISKSDERIKKRLTRISLGRPGKTFWLDWACQWAERGERARLELLQAGLVSADVSATPSRSSDSGRRSVNCVTTTPHHAQAPPGQRRPTVTQCSDWLSAADGSLVSKL